MPSRPSELDSSVEDDDEMDVSEQSAQVVPEIIADIDRITRLERGVEEDRDLFDRLRDIVEDLECEVASLRTWKQNVEDKGCSGCSRKAFNSADAPHPAVPLTGSASSSRRVAAPAALTPSPPMVSSSSGAGIGQAQDTKETRASVRVTKTRTPRNDTAVVDGAVNIVAPPVTPVTILRRPTYATSDEECVVSSYASVAAGNSRKDGYSVVAGRKRFASKKAVTPDPITSIPLRERHLTVKFVRERDTKSVLPQGVTVGVIRDALNRSRYALKCNAYFSVASLGKWGDVLLTLAATRVGDIAGYYPALRDTLESLNIGQFTCLRDTQKCKVFVGMVPLSRFGGGWQPREWEGRTAFDHLSADIENSNPGIVVAAKPSWAGRLHKLKERRVNNAGLILVLEMTPEVRKMMAAAQPRITVVGRPRVCRLWREDNPTVVCAVCQTVGHRSGECKNKPVCAFCHKDHLTAKHLCPVMSCRKLGTACAHVHRLCLLCNSNDHFTGHRDCDALRGASSSPPGLGPATLVVADHTSVVGVSDESRGRLRRQAASRPGTALAPHMINNGVSAHGIRRSMLRSDINPDRTVHNKEVRVPRLDKGKAVARSLSAPADVSRAGGNVTLSEW